MGGRQARCTSSSHRVELATIVVVPVFVTVDAPSTAKDCADPNVVCAPSDATLSTNVTLLATSKRLAIAHAFDMLRLLSWNLITERTLEFTSSICMATFTPRVTGVIPLRSTDSPHFHEVDSCQEHDRVTAETDAKATADVSGIGIALEIRDGALCLRSTPRRIRRVDALVARASIRASAA